MADVSKQLRRARERAGLEISDISARTKIKPAFVAAIDRGRLEELPGQFFTRAFLKAYAKEVGINPDDIARQYDELSGRTDPITLEELAAALEQRHPAVPLAVRPRYDWDTVPPPPEGTVGSRARALRLRIPKLPALRFARPAVVALVAIVIAVTAALIRTPGRATAEAGAVGTSGVVAQAPAPASPPAVPDKVTMEITPDEQIWVAATADGEPAVFRMLQAGERVTLSATRELRFRIGNASAFKFSINGAAGKSLGAAGEVKEFQVTPENYRTFVQ